MAEFKVQNKSESPIHVELIHDGVIYYCKCDVKPGDLAEFLVPPVVWDASAFLSCDATKTDHSKTIDPDAMVIIHNKPYYIAGSMPKEIVQKVDGAKNLPRDKQADYLIDVAASVVIGGLHIPREYALRAIGGVAGFISADSLRRVTLAVSREIYDGATLKALKGTEDCEMSVEGGSVDFDWDPTLLLFTATAKSTPSGVFHPPYPPLSIRAVTSMGPRFSIPPGMLKVPAVLPIDPRELHGAIFSVGPGWPKGNSD